MDDRRYPRPLSGYAVLIGSVYPAEDDVPAGQGRVFAVIYLFHLASRQAGIHRLPDGTEPGSDAGFLPAAFLCQYAGYQSVFFAAFGPSRVSDPGPSGG